MECIVKAHLQNLQEAPPLPLPLQDLSLQTGLWPDMFLPFAVAHRWPVLMFPGELDGLCSWSHILLLASNKSCQSARTSDILSNRGAAKEELALGVRCFPVFGGRSYVSTPTTKDIYLLNKCCAPPKRKCVFQSPAVRR